MVSSGHRDEWCQAVEVVRVSGGSAGGGSDDWFQVVEAMEEGVGQW